jgi:hypothetical protein
VIEEEEGERKGRVWSTNDGEPDLKTTAKLESHYEKRKKERNV